MSRLAYAIDISWQNITAVGSGITLTVFAIAKWISARKSIAAQLAVQTADIKAHADRLYNDGRERELKQYERMFVQQETVHSLEKKHWELQRAELQGEMDVLKGQVKAMQDEQKRLVRINGELHGLNEALQTNNIKKKEIDITQLSEVD